MHLTVASSWINSQGLLSRKKLEYLKSTVVSCGEIKGAAQSDIDEILAHKAPSNQLGKCIEACVIEHAGIVSRFILVLKLLKSLISIFHNCILLFFSFDEDER